jgi:hypothetical protein
MYVPLDEPIPDLTVGSDFGREQSLRTMEDVHQNGEFSLLQVTPHVIDVCHHILYTNGRVNVSVSVCMCTGTCYVYVSGYLNESIFM